MVSVVYSLRSDLVGLAIAAFIVWKLTVANATRIAAPPAPTKTHTLTFTL